MWLYVLVSPVSCYRVQKKKSSALEGESVRATQAEHTGSSHHTRVRAHHTNTHTQYMLPRGCS